MPPRPRNQIRCAGQIGAVNREVISEETVNALLAHLLRDHGIAAQAEGGCPDIVPDVRVTLQTGDTVLLECRWEDSADQLENRLSACLRQSPDVLGVIGVLYPMGLQYLDDTRDGLEHAGDLEWWPHGVPWPAGHGTPILLWLSR